MAVLIVPPVRTMETILTLLKNKSEGFVVSQWKVMKSLVSSAKERRDFRFPVD